MNPYCILFITCLQDNAREASTCCLSRIIGNDGFIYECYMTVDEMDAKAMKRKAQNEHSR